MNRQALFLTIPSIALTLSLGSCDPNRLKRAACNDQTPLKEEIQTDTCYVYDSIGGNALFSIYAGTQIESVPTDNPEWNELAVTVAISSQEVSSNEIEEGKVLTNQEKEKIGEVYKTQNFWDKDKNGSQPVGILRGFIKKRNIDPNTIIENIIKKRCASVQNRNLSGMEEIVSKYDFVYYQFDSLLTNLDFYKEEYKDLSDIEEYILEDSWLSDPGADRLSLLFLQEQLIAIVHKRPLELDNLPTFRLPGGRRMIILPHVNETIADKLVKFKTEFYTSFFD